MGGPPSSSLFPCGSETSEARSWGGFAKRRRVRGFSPRIPNAQRDTPHPALRATFSHKGRRKGSSRAVAARDLFLLVELGAAPRQFFRAHLSDVVVVELPGGIRAPAQRRLHRGAGACRGLQQPQRQFERQRLRLHVLRLARGIAERKIRKQEA